MNALATLADKLLDESIIGAVVTVAVAMLGTGWLNRRQSRRLMDAQAEEAASRAGVSEVEAERVELTMARDLLTDLAKERERADTQITALTEQVRGQAEEIATQRDLLTALRLWVELASKTLQDAGLPLPAVTIPSPRR